MEHNLNFYSILIISILAFILPLLVTKIRRVKIPVVIAEIVAGIIFGKSGLNIIHNDLWIEFLSLFGFAYLMFLSGVEIDFSYFKKKNTNSNGKANPVVLGVVLFILTLIASYSFALVLQRFGIVKNPLFLTLIFSTTSLGIVVPILKEKQIINTSIGQTILISALIADFATMLMIPVVMYLVESKKSTDLLTSLIVFFAFALAYYASKKFFKVDFNNPTFETSQLKVRAAFALVLIFVTISQVANVEIILGAFLAGVLFSLVFDEFRTEIAPKLDAIGYGFLIPIFFIMIGVKLDLWSVLNVKTLISLPIYIFIVYMVKLIPSLLLKIFFSWRETIGAGFLISSRLSLIIAVSLVALNAGVINETTHSTFILVAIVTCVLSPLLFYKIFPEYEKKKEAILIAGNNNIIISIASKLNSDEETLILADSHEKIVSRLRELDVKFTYVEKMSKDVFKVSENANISTFLLAYESSSKNIETYELFKDSGINNIVAVIEDARLSTELEKNGVKTISPLKAMYTLLYGIIKYPESFEVLYNPEDSNDIEVREVKLVSQSVIGKKLKRVPLPGDCLILLVARNGKRIVPDGNTRLETGDVVVVIGNKEYMERIEDVFV